MAIERPSHAEFHHEIRHGSHSGQKVPKLAMNAKVRSRYHIASEPVWTLLGATGVAYGWMVKKYHAQHSEEKTVHGEEEEHDWQWTHDDRQGTRKSYKEFAHQFHSESWSKK